MADRPSCWYSLRMRLSTLRGARSASVPSKLTQSWMICAVGSLAHGTGRTVLASGIRRMSGSATEVKSCSGKSPVTVIDSTASGRRRPSAGLYLWRGTILPRASPVMSGIRHSTSVIRFSSSHCWIFCASFIG
ncbi:hypothetical protein D3C72_1595040 [compost metagenome]